MSGDGGHASLSTNSQTFMLGWLRAFLHRKLR